MNRIKYIILAVLIALTSAAVGFCCVVVEEDAPLSGSCHVLGKNIIGDKYFVQTWVEVTEHEYDSMEIGDEFELRKLKVTEAED